MRVKIWPDCGAEVFTVKNHERVQLRRGDRPDDRSGNRSQDAVYQMSLTGLDLAAVDLGSDFHSVLRETG